MKKNYFLLFVFIISLILSSGCMKRYSYCGDSICSPSEDLYTCPIDCKGSIPILEPDKEYAVKLNERYQFEYRQIELSSIWDESVVVNVKFDTQLIGPKIDVGSSQDVLGIMISLVKVHFELEKEAHPASSWIYTRYSC